MSGFVAYMESDSRSIEKDGTLVGERRNHVARSVMNDLHVLYFNSNSFANYSWENSLITDLRFFIACTIFGAYFVMNSWKSNVYQRTIKL